MMEKRMAASSEEKPVVLGASESKPEEKPVRVCDKTFPVGGRYFVQGRMWRITESHYSDNTDMRRVSSSVGDDAILTLRSLEKDMGLPDFKFLPDDEMSELLRIAAENEKR